MPSADSLNFAGSELHKAGDLIGAKIHYIAALRERPMFVPSLMNLVDILSRQNLLQAAAPLAARATVAAPNLPAAWNNHGNILTRLERYEEARISLVTATTLAPEDVSAWHNFLLLNLREGNLDEAESDYRRIVELGGDSPTVRNDYAHTLLARGDLAQGLAEYESRWSQLYHLEPWDLHIPEWQGQDLTGQRLLVHAEQGFGDTIMTSRFLVYFMLGGAAKITFAVPSTLIELFEHQNYQKYNVEICNVHELDERDASRFDYHSPLFSAIRWLNIQPDSISPAPYQRTPDSVVAPIYPDAFNVGICWSSGSRGGEMDWRRRVSPLDLWLPLAEIPNVCLWSLCPGEEAQSDITRLGAEAIIEDRVSTFSNFAETAAFIDKLDLVITVDTAVAHLAAAMGKPTWMLSQFTPCWRWWDLAGGTGKPWYDTMEILVQPAPGDWRSQLEECGQNLCLAAQKAARKVAA